MSEEVSEYVDTRGVELVPAEIGTAPAPMADLISPLLKAGADWRRQCLHKVEGLPAGYTYLAQLMAHDLGNSRPLAQAPWVRHLAATSSSPVRYNLIENPLTLETIYGPGPSMASHLFDPVTRKFRIAPRARITHLFPNIDRNACGFRALHDERNRDTLMLHELAAAWMVFHNLCFDLLRQTGTGADEVHGRCRQHSVRVWHQIIRGDLLTHLVHPAIQPIAPTDAWELDVVSLLHGLLRVFHSLPLSSYDLGTSGRQNLSDLMAQGYKVSSAESAWHVDWPLMFSGQGSQTGISASHAPALSSLPRTSHGASVRLTDLKGQTLRETYPVKFPDLDLACTKLPEDWPAKVSTTALAAAFATEFPDAPVHHTARELAEAPIFLPLMIEGQLHGEHGGLGPLGSALLMGTITAALDRVRFAEPPDSTGTLPTPKTMLELINIAREETQNG